ncbi:MAG: tetratricopeptide repeat protein [Candidatus Electronema sp. V4]|uniref:tetratricopeptide repeat protein n=1 Tax=Candidatus Electronema sp. V4 TaxID=3454756 RepID=UPI0040554501
MNDIRLHGAAVYNPALWSREELKDYFVARTELLDRIVADLGQEQPGGPCRHRLILGLRGMGKSTLLRRIGIAVEEDTELGKCWLPLTFPEEQYNISTAADLWRNCLDAFCDLLEERGRKDEADALDKVVDAVEDALARLLAEADKLGCRLLLLMDNMDLILERLKGEQEQLRAIFQGEARLLLIGASTQPVEADFFHATDELQGLSVEEMRATLRKLAELGKTPQVAQLLDDDPARIKTLHNLTGGNPRTIVLLYNVLARGLDGDVRSDLEGLLDLVTPLYKARFEELPQQAQQLMNELAVNWDPMTARQLADKLVWDVNTASAQLNRLQQQGHVKKVDAASGKRAAFQIGERFFNIWYLMRASRRERRKLIWLVHFLRMFFSASELQGHAKKLLREEKNDVRWAEYKLALARTIEDISLKEGLNCDALRCLLRQEKDSRKIEAMFDLQGEDAELRPLLSNLKVEALIDQAVQDGIMTAKDDVEGAERAAQKHNEPGLIADVWVNWFRGHFEDHLSAQQAEKTEKSFLDALHDDAADASRWHYNLGWLLATKLNRYDEAEAAYRKAIEIRPDYALFWKSLGRLIERLERFDEAETAYKKALEIKPDYDWLWHKLGLLLERLERYEEAEDAYRKEIDIKPTSSRYNVFAWFLYERKDKFDEAILFAKKSIELEYNLPAVHTLATLLVANKQWLEAEPYIRALLAKGTDEFFEEYWQDMLTLFQEAVRTGRAAEALALLEESSLAERWRPLREALAAAKEGNVRYLNGVAPEVRQPALEILKTIAPDVLPPEAD